MALIDLLHSDASMLEIAAHLDALDPTARVNDMYAL